MKNLLILSLIAVIGATQVRANDANTPRSELVDRVDTCEAILREFQSNRETAIPPRSGRRPAA